MRRSSSGSPPTCSASLQIFWALASVMSLTSSNLVEPKNRFCRSFSLLSSFSRSSRSLRRSVASGLPLVMTESKKRRGVRILLALDVDAAGA